MKTLLSITADVRALLELIEECDAELDAATEASLDDFFREVKAAEGEKLEGYCRLVRTLELRAAVRREESERLIKLVRSEENKARRLKERLKMHMELTQAKRIDTATYRITLVANGGKSPLELPPDAKELPPEYQTVLVESNNEAIRDALESGVKVPGCRLLERGRHVRLQ